MGNEGFVERIIGVSQRRHTACGRQHLAQQLQILGAKLAHLRGDAGDISAGPGEALHQPSATRIGRQDNDRNALGGLLDRGRGRCRIGEQYIDLTGNELRRQWHQITSICAADAQLEDDVCSLDIAEITQALLDTLDELRRIGISGDQNAKRGWFARLRHSGERPRHTRAAHEEFASLHVYPWSQKV